MQRRTTVQQEFQIAWWSREFVAHAPCLRNGVALQGDTPLIGLRNGIGLQADTPIATQPDGKRRDLLTEDFPNAVLVSAILSLTVL